MSSRFAWLGLILALTLFLGPGATWRARAQAGLPVISSEPADQSVGSGSDATFSVSAAGATPLFYQWLRNGTNILQATNDAFTITNVQIFNAGGYSVIVSNSVGSVTSVVARLTVDADLTFRVIALTTNGAVAVEHNAVTGDDRGGIAVSPSSVFVTGDGSTGLFPIGNLAAGTTLGTIYEGLTGNLRTEQAYVLANGSTPIPSGGGTISSLIELDGATGALTANRIDLSQPISAFGGSGIFAGYDRVVIHTGSRAFNIALPSGVVTDLGPSPPLNHASGEGWSAYWGVAEFFGGAIHVLYVQSLDTVNFRSTNILRSRLPDGATTVAATFPGSGLADMASFTFSISQGRWFFHHEGTSVFRSGDETVGSAKAYYSADPGFPTILVDPRGQTNLLGSNVTFTVTAAGTEPLHYQWFYNGSLINGATDTSLTLNGLQTNQNGFYTVQVGNDAGQITSVPAVLFVVAAPIILAPPQDVIVPPGTNATFSVLAVGPPPLFYHWRLNGKPVAGATNSTLVVNNVKTNDAGAYSVQVSNVYGSVISADAFLTVFDVSASALVFRIASLQTNGSAVVDINALAGDDRGGIAVSPTSVFITGDNATVRYSPVDLSGGVSLGTVHNGLVSNLRTEQVYLLANGTTPTVSGGTITSLLELNSSGAQTGNRINLSRPIAAVFNNDQPGIFSGYDRIVIHNNTNVFNIDLPSGTVTDLGLMPPLPNHTFSENWAYWGIAENDHGVVWLAYVTFNSAIVRTRVPDGFTTNIAQFSNLSDMASFTVSVPRQRWYFHYEGNAQFGGTSETLGYAAATFTIVSALDHYEWGPIAPVQQIGVPFTATLTAKNSLNETVTSFNSPVDLAGFLPGGAPVAVSPSQLDNFVGGVWTGQITVLDPAVDMVLRVQDSRTNVGLSLPFSVVGTNDLFVSITELPDPVTVLQNLTYLLTVTNTGPADSTGVRLTNTLPNLANFVSLSSSQGACTNQGGVISCDLGVLPTGTNATVTITVTTLVAGSLTNRANVTRNEPDAFPANDTAIAITTVNPPALSINDISVTEGNAASKVVNFSVTLSQASTQRVTVAYATSNGTAQAGSDYAIRSGTVTFNAGVTTQSLAISILGDTLFETNKFFFVNLSSPSNAILGKAQGVCTILNDDSPPILTISNVLASEGNFGSVNALIPVRLSTTPGVDVTVDYFTTDGSAADGADYSGRLGTLRFPAGTSNLIQFVFVPILGDVLGETNEDFFITLTNAVNATLGRTQAVCTIVSDEGPGILDHFEWSTLAPTQFVNSPFAVSLTAKDIFNDTIPGFSSRVALNGRTGGGFATTNILGNRTSDFNGNGDYTIGNTFTPTTNILVTHVRHYWGTKVSIWTDAGGLLATTPVASAVSNWLETPLPVPLQLQAGTRYRLAAYSGGVNGAYYLVPTNFPIAFQHVTFESGVFATGDNFPDLDSGPAIWFVDVRYTVASFLNVPIQPTVTPNFTNGVWTGDIIVLQSATNLTLLASDTNFFKNGLSDSFDVITDPNLIGTNDLALRVAVAPDPVLAGQPLTYVLSVTNSGPAGSSGVRLTNALPADLPVVSILPSQGTCSNIAGVIVCALGAVPAGSTATVTVTVVPQTGGFITNIVGVARNEPEALLENNTRTIVSTVLLPSLSINDISVTEGNSASKVVNFTVTLSQASTQRVTVAFATANAPLNNTAVAGSDYAIRSGTLTFNAGVTTQSLAISILGDAVQELDEVFYVNLSSPSNAMLARAQGVCTILNDDAAPFLTISNLVVIEGNSGSVNALIPVRLSATPGFDVSVGYFTTDGSATSGSDYDGTVGSLLFSAGTTSLTQFIPVSITGDLIPEPNESFFITLTNAINATLGNTQAVCTIVSDEGPGILDHFEWSPTGPTQYVNAPFPVSLTAKDVLGGTATSFSGPVSLAGLIGSAAAPLFSDGFEDGNFSDWAIGNDTVTRAVTSQTAAVGTYSFTITGGNTHYNGISHSLASITPDRVTFFVRANNATSPGGYFVTGIGTELSQQAVFFYMQSNGRMGPVNDLASQPTAPYVANQWYKISFAFNWANRTVDYFVDDVLIAAGFRFRGVAVDRLSVVHLYNFANKQSWWDEIQFIQGSVPVTLPITPTGASNFVNGVWTGSITVLQSATNLTLRATDAVSHRGDAGPLTILPPVSDLALTLIDSPDPVAVSNSLTYTITVLNRGPSHATAFTVTDKLPPGVLLVSVVSSNGSCVNVAGTVTCNLTNLPSGSRATITLVVKPRQAGTLTNTATAAVTGATDPLGLNNSASAITTVFSDRDRDGMPDQWEVDNALNPDDPGDGPLDPDGDGMTNLQEYLAGTNPHDAGSVLQITRVEMVGREMHIYFTGVSGKRYRLERQVEGAPPTWVGVLDIAAGATTELEVIDVLPAGEATRIYRVRLLLP